MTSPLSPEPNEPNELNQGNTLSATPASATLESAAGLAQGIGSGSPAVLLINLVAGLLTNGVIILAILGVMITLIAVLGLQWPLPANADVGNTGALTTRLFSQRLQMRMDLGDAASTASLILDVLVYISLALAVVFIVVSLSGRSRAPYMGLVLVGVFGVIYVFGSALYVGPMISLCGFSLILFVGAVLWFSFPIAPRKDDEPKVNDGAPSAAAPADVFANKSE